MVADIVKPANRKQTKTVNASATITQYVYPDAGKDLTKVTVNGLTASAALGNAATDDVAEGKTFSSSNGILLTGTGAIIPNAHVYGAEWAGGSDPSWTRTDESANFSDPNPYYSGMSTTPSSPFDGLMPWAGIRRVSDTNAGELVEIPKFWYKWTRDGAKMKLQIADNYKPGFYTSPAHADRGDDVGERDYVYVGRYLCDKNSYKSISGGLIEGKNIATYRSNIHNLGSNIWQWDYATFLTIGMLYLVEYANWDSTCIGAGGGTGINFGYTDSMPYHTGTTKNSRTTMGEGCQYRHIEGLYDAAGTLIDGIYMSGSNIYIYKNPANFTNSTSGTGVQYVGTRMTTETAYIKSYGMSNVSGFEWFIYPNADSSSKGYTNARYTYHPYGANHILYGGGATTTDSSVQWACQLFSCNQYTGDNDSYFVGRLMVLPPSRLSA